jgi:hypothetical protein
VSLAHAERASIPDPASASCDRSDPDNPRIVTAAE